MSPTATKVQRSAGHKQDTASRKGSEVQRESSALAMRSPGQGATAVQTKMSVSMPGDASEVQADRVAAQVQHKQTAETLASQDPRDHGIDRKASSCDCGCNGQNARCIHRAADGAVPGPPPVTPETAATIRSPGAGRPLSPAMRGQIEAPLGADLGGVRVHDGPQADAASVALQARSFTVGNDIFLRRGESSEDLGLMAHEATHVVQQGAAGSREGAAAQPGATTIGRATGEKQVQRSLWGDITGVAGAVWDATGGKVVDAAGAVIEMGADLFWKLVRRVAPQIEPFLHKGIFETLKDWMKGAFNNVFGGITGDAGVLATIITTLNTLVGGAGKILAALASGDCGPLFDAVGKLMDAVGTIAGEVWDGIKAFFTPIGKFLGDLWDAFGAPVVDFYVKMAGDTWNAIKQLASDLWDWTQPIRDALAAAWDWVKEQLFGSSDAGGEGGSGIWGWIKDKAAEVWSWIKEQVQPVIGPIVLVVTKIKSIIPLDAILNLRKTVTDWLSNVGKMAKSMSKPKDTVENQDALRAQILPAVMLAIVGLRQDLINAGMWVADGIGGLATTVIGWIETLKGNSLLGAFSGAFSWLESGVTNLSQWVQGGVIGLFTWVGDGLVYLSQFIEPVLNTLQKVVAVIGDVVSELPGLVLGPMWKLIPACIRDPIQDFIVEHILKHIPVINKFLNIKEIWAKIQTFVMDFLKEVFINGDLSAAAMVVIRFVCDAVGIKFELLLKVVGGAADVLVDILMEPVKFLSNLFDALKLGMSQFVDNIVGHLFNGLLSWLLGPLQDLGVTPPKIKSLGDLTLGMLLDLALQIMGISGPKIKKKIEDQLPGKAAKTMFDTAWKWVSGLIEGGLAGLWDEIKNSLTGIWDMIIGGITEWVTTELIKVGLEQLAMLSNPVGAVLDAIKVIYETLSFLVDKINQILEMVDAVISSVAKIVAGNISEAANWIEDAMGRTVPLIIAFVSDLIGFGDPAPSVRGIVMKVQAKVDKALDWLVDKAIKIGGKILKGLGLGGDDKPGDEERPEVKAGLAAIEAEDAAQEKKEGGASKEQAEAIAAKVKKDFPVFKMIDVVASGDNWQYQYAASPMKPGPTVHQAGLPKQRGLPKGYKVRYNLYEKGSGWDTVRENVGKEDRAKFKKIIKDTVKLYKTKPAQAEANLQALVPIPPSGQFNQDAVTELKNGTLDETYVDNTTYHVDHKTPLALHWQNEGHNAGEAERHAMSVGRSNLHLLTARANLSKGSKDTEGDPTSDDRYYYSAHPWVGQQFTAPGSTDTKIDGQNFVKSP